MALPFRWPLRRAQHSQLKVHPVVEQLEERTTPAINVFSAAGATPAAIQTAVTNFQNALGANNGVGGTFSSGFRQINWDGVPVTSATPTPLPNNFFNSTSARGVVFTNSANNSFQVSSNAPSNLFSNINSSYLTQFQTFSAPRLFAPIGTNITDVGFFLPGTTMPALTNAFGVVFVNVETATSARLEFYDTGGGLLYSQFVAPAGPGGLSFLGVQLPRATVGRVRIISGTVPLGATDNGNSVNVVPLDDFIYGEPQMTPANLHPLTAIGQASGGSAVAIYDTATKQIIATLTPFGAFQGGARVAMGDVNGDGIPDIIVGAGPGGAPQVSIFDGRTFQLINTFDALPPGFAGGVYVAATDVNQDGFSDIIASADKGGGPEVAIYSGQNLSLLNAFFAFTPNFAGGVRVAAATVNGTPEVFAGAGPGGGPAVTIFNGQTGQAINAFFASAPGFTEGVFVAAGAVTGNGVQDIVVGLGGLLGIPSTVNVFDSGSLLLIKTLSPFSIFNGGVSVGTGPDVSGETDIITGAGPGGGPQVTFFNGITLTQLDSLFAFSPTFSGGVFVTGPV
jgi:hypothetical protein